MAAHRLNTWYRMNVLRCAGLGVMMFSLLLPSLVRAKVPVILEAKNLGKKVLPPLHSQRSSVNAVQSHKMTQGHRTEKKAAIKPSLRAVQNNTIITRKNQTVKSNSNEVLSNKIIVNQPVIFVLLNNSSMRVFFILVAYLLFVAGLY